MNSNVYGKHILIELDIGQNLLADAIENEVLSEYDTNVEQVHSLDHDQIYICVDEQDVNANKKNKQHANDMKHFCKGMEALANALGE